MTKNKKKMAKSTIAIIVMAVVMVAMLAFGGTYAYFTASSNAATPTNPVRTGYLSVKENSVGTVATNLVVPGDTITNGVQFKTASTVAQWLVVEFTVTFDGAAADAAVLTYTMAEGWGTAIEGKDGHKYFVKEEAAPADSAITDGVTADRVINVCGEIKFAATEDNKESEADTTLQYMNKTLTLSVQSWSIQKTGVANANAALEALGLKASA